MTTFRLLTTGAIALGAAGAAGWCRAGEAFAPLLAQPLLAQQGGMTVTADSKSFIVESLVTAVLFGAALWVVCRSSRRV